MDEFEQYFGLLEPPHVVVHSLASKQRVLEELKPKFVVIFDPDISFFRQLEVYKAENPGLPLRVYWLWYANSVEEKMYLAAVEKENRAFQSLIDQKEVFSLQCLNQYQTMVIPTDREGKIVVDITPPELIRGNSRKGGVPRPLKPVSGRKVCHAFMF